MVTGLRIDQSLFEVLTEADLQGFRRQICIDLQLTKLDHFDHVNDRDLQNIGLSLPAIRRLRESLVQKKHEMRRFPERDVRTVVVPPDDTGLPPEISQPGTSSIKKDQIKLLDTLGEGTFAVVKRAFWTTHDGRKLDVAVKILRDASPLVMEELQKEVNSLEKLNHPNLIRLYGVVSDATWMVFELCEGGSLLDRLRNRKKPPLLVSQMLDFSQQIAKGMTFLEMKHCVHRDLAARNILLSVDERTVKICDFGLMRSLEENERLYIMNPQKRVPFAWCPPESLRFRQFSHASDVWAMGVLMWEIYSFGEDPWAGLRGRDVLERTDAGERLPKPRFCSQQVYDLMDLCWKSNPDARPKFKMLWGLLKQASFSIAEVREAHPAANDQQLELRIGDRVQIIENTGVTWFGQSERTRCFGNFMRSVVFVKSANETGRDGNQKISRPIAGSFIHTGHGDIRDGKGWGNPEYIDKIYLTNPVVGQPNSSSAPQIIDSILPPPHKAKPNLPSKPPASSSNAVSEGIPLSPTMRDPFDDVRLSRATRQVAPTPTLMQPIVQQVGSSQFYVPSMNQPIPARVAPAPPTTQPKVHSNGNAAVPRPKVNLPQEPSSSRSANNTPPMIKADAFVNVRNAAQRMDGFVIAPKTSGAGIPLAVIEPGPAPKSSVGIGHGQNILNELQSKIGKGNEPIRLRQQPTTSAETPVFVHSQMNTMRAPSSFSSISPNAHDPFEVPSAVKNVLQKDRYNEIMEKNSLQPAPSPPAYNQPHRHPNSTPQLHVNQVLQPIQSPSSARATTSPHPLQNFHHAQGPVHPSLNHVHLGQASRMSMITPPTVAIPQQQRPMSQVLTPTPIKQQPTLAQQQLQQQKQQEMILQQIQQQKQEQFLREQRMQQEKLAQEKLLQQQREQQIRQQREQLAKQQMPKVESTPALLPTQGLKPSGQNGVRQTTAAALSTPVLQPTKVELPSATANVKPTSQTPKSEPKQAVNSNAQNGQAQANGSSRRHTTEIDFTTIFPAPSALFYGSDSTKSTSSQGDQPQQVRPPISTIAAAIPTVDVVREARVIPSVLPSSSVLQPTPLHHANLNSAAQQRRASTSTPIVAPPAQKAATPRPAASVLPSEPLVPTPLYPKISTIAQPQTQNVSPPRTRGFSQEQVDAILALSSRPQSIHSVPLFSAQQSLGSTYSNGYGGYNSPIYGMGYGASSPIYGGYGMNGFNGLNGYGSMGRLSNTSSVYPLLSDSSRPLALTAPLRPLTPPPPSSTIVQHSEEVLNSFDPLAELYNNSQSTLPRESQPTTSGVTKAEQMEILYKEASFAERGNCDRMVGICGGNVEEALKQLKVEYLVDTGIASDRAIAISALEARAWNLNAAAEAIVSR